MRGFVCIIVLLLNSFALKAQEGGIYWITPSRQCFAEEVVFVRNLPLESKSLKAKITIASEQQFTLFVNQRNVSTAVLEPYRPSSSLRVKSRKLRHHPLFASRQQHHSHCLHPSKQCTFATNNCS